VQLCDIGPLLSGMGQHGCTSYIDVESHDGVPEARRQTSVPRRHGRISHRRLTADVLSAGPVGHIDGYGGCEGVESQPKFGTKLYDDQLHAIQT
jgi:hypothetical protein